MRRTVHAIICTVLCSWGTAQVSTASAQPLKELDRQFIGDLERLQSGGIKPQDAAANCRYYMRVTDEREMMEQMMSGFLDVPAAEALQAFCAALVEAVASERLPVSKMRNIVVNEDPDVLADGVGRMLRELYFAHERRPLVSSQKRTTP